MQLLCAMDVEAMTIYNLKKNMNNTPISSLFFVVAAFCVLPISDSSFRFTEDH